MENGSDLTGIAFVVLAATFCGLALARLRQPAIIGFILAGVLLGPSGFGLVENRDNVALLAELGVILLLFFIGMELSLRSFRVLWKLAVGAAMAQIALSVGLTWALGAWFGWPAAHAILLGFCLAMSSTAVAIKILDQVGQLRTRVGKVTVGILIAQDLAVAPMILIVGNLGGSAFSPWVILEIALTVGLLIALILALTRRKRVDMPFHRLIVGDSDLGPLAALGVCFGGAALAGLAGLSPAFGAFLAGLVAGNSNQRRAIHRDAGPIQAVLLMMFFLSIGLLLDLGYVIDNWALVLGVVLFVALFKTAMNLALLRAQGLAFNQAFQVSLTIGQLGEFAFVLAATALAGAAIDEDLYKLIVAATVLSLVLGPIYVDALQRLQSRAAERAPSLGKLLRLIYFREWRALKRAGAAARAGALRLGAGARRLRAKVKRR